MELIRGLYNLREHHRGSVATIGNFDGVHRGHQAVMNQLHEAADELNTHSTVITFEPLPEEHFLGPKAPARLTPLCDKIALLNQLGINQVLCLPFNAKLAQLSAEDFIRSVLVEGLGIKKLVVGDDFRFGHQRKGDFALLQQEGKKHGFDVVDTHTYTHDDSRVSSTRIREALEASDFKAAEHFLGHPFTMGGRVFHGDKRGRQLGFPTANIHIARRISPLRGVFAVEVDGIGNQTVRGVANIGNRPTVGGVGFQIEVHLLDFSGDLYGKRIQIRWRHKIRSEQKFDSLDDLVERINVDIEQARLFFENESNRD